MITATLWIIGVCAALILFGGAIYLIDGFIQLVSVFFIKKDHNGNSL